MAATYTLIASNTLGSSAASVTFSSIPSTYTDLVLRISARANTAGSVVDSIRVRFNSDTATNYSHTFIAADTVGGTAFSGASSGNTEIQGNYTTSAAGATSNVFSNAEIYIPSYLASQNKPASFFGVGENNAIESYISNTAGLWRNAAAVTSILLFLPATANFVSGSSFYLYGIKNS